MAIESIRSLGLFEATAPGMEARVPGAGDEKFSAFLEKSVGELNSLLSDADRKATDLATGKTENLHETMIALEKADTALKLMMQVRNKALEAYHEILRMQV